jgi:hypothetical protein
VAKLDTQNRAERVEVQPDARLRVTQVYDVLDYVVRNGEASFLAEIKLPWGTPHPTYDNCRLVKQDVLGQIENPFKQPNDPPPQLVRVWDQIPENDQVIVGEPGISYDQYGRKTVVIEYIQFSAGTSTYAYVVGTTPAPAPNTECILKTYESTNDGTLIRKKLTFIDSGELSDTEELKFDGNLVVRTLTYLNEIPPTPAGFSLVTTSTEFVEGLPVYRYGFVKAEGGSSGSDGVISDKTSYNISPDQGTTGVTVRTIRKVTPSSVNTNPINNPIGYELIDVDYDDQDGYRLWTAVYAFGQGLVSSDVDISNDGKLYVYSKRSINAAPSAPSPSIGGTVVLIKSSVRNGTDAAAGTVVYDYQWAEGNGIISNKSQTREDGSIVYTVVELDAAAMTPAYPGTGTGYLVALDQDARDGHYVNTATYIKPPATVTLKKVVNFKMPGLAQFSGNNLIITPPSDRTLEADQEISYDTTQNSDVPYAVQFGAYLRESYIRANNNGVGEYRNDTLSYILANPDGISGTNDYYNGVLCEEFDVTLNSSEPTARPSGVTVIDKDNSIYLMALNGTIVYRRVKVSYDFT